MCYSSLLRLIWTEHVGTEERTSRSGSAWSLEQASQIRSGGNRGLDVHIECIYKYEPRVQGRSGAWGGYMEGKIWQTHQARPQRRTYRILPGGKGVYGFRGVCESRGMQGGSCLKPRGWVSSKTEWTDQSRALNVGPRLIRGSWRKVFRRVYSQGETPKEHAQAMGDGELGCGIEGSVRQSLAVFLQLTPMSSTM